MAARRLVGTHVFVGRSQKKKKEKKEGPFTMDSGIGRSHDCRLAGWLEVYKILVFCLDREALAVRP